jgi:excisionase family DNA binding protein
MAINRASTEYYNLEKVAEVLSVSAAEVNRLREQNKLRGFRDGATWKFNKEEVHAYLAESIRARNGGNTTGQPGDSDFDLAGNNASDSSFDLLDAALPDEDQLISAVPAPAKSDLDLAALDQDSDLALAEETHVSSFVVPSNSNTPIQLQEEPEAEQLLEVDLEDDSSALSLASAYDEDGSVLGAESSSPQLGLAGDSGFDVLVADEDALESDILLVDEEKTEAVFTPAEDFTLEPTPKVPEDDDSESSSQVIAIDVGFTPEAQDADPFGGDTFGDFSGFDSGLQPSPEAAAATTNDSFAASPSPAAFDFAAAAPAPVKKPAAPEEEYSTGMLIALVAALVVMILPGIMMLDTMMHLWSWGGSFTLTSYLMSSIAGLFGL